jgi:hypothetical protein
MPKVTANNCEMYYEYVDEPEECINAFLKFLRSLK